MASLYPEHYRAMLKRLRAARIAAGYSQEAAAEALGLKQTFISRVELGERRLDPAELHAFARLYGTDLNSFFD